MIINKQEAARLIHETNGTVFSVTFIKRSTGEVRTGLFRLGYTVQKGLAGGEAPYSFEEKGLIPVYRMAGDKSESDGQRRTIPIEGILNLKANGKDYEVV
jgi:hypothetical protein